jgi:hypothetical protein
MGGHLRLTSRERCNTEQGDLCARSGRRQRWTARLYAVSKSLHHPPESLYRVAGLERRIELARSDAILRDLRALRYAAPGFAKEGVRRRAFQSALEQCEQFLAAAYDAGYATRPVQLFYALSQAGRAIVAASPHVGNQNWKVSGHGLKADTNTEKAADVTVVAGKAGLFPSVAAALAIEPLPSGERVSLREL